MANEDQPINPFEHPNLKLDFGHLSEEAIYAIIEHDLLTHENIAYRNGQSVPAEHKLLFLVAVGDIRSALDSTGSRIYTKSAPYSKVCEVSEFTAACSAHLEKKPDINDVLSEFADMFYNVVQLRRLDPLFKSEYDKWLNVLANSLGLTMHQAGLLTIAKYSYRLVANHGKKDVASELTIINSLRSQQGESDPLIPTPTNEQVSRSLHLVDLLERFVLHPRLLQLQAENLWGSYNASSV